MLTNLVEEGIVKLDQVEIIQLLQDHVENHLMVIDPKTESEVDKEQAEAVSVKEDQIFLPQVRKLRMDKDLIKVNQVGEGLEVKALVRDQM